MQLQKIRWDLVILVISAHLLFIVFSSQKPCMVVIASLFCKWGSRSSVQSLWLESPVSLAEGLVTGSRVVSQCFGQWQGPLWASGPLREAPPSSLIRILSDFRIWVWDRL